MNPDVYEFAISKGEGTLIAYGYRDNAYDMARKIEEQIRFTEKSETLTIVVGVIDINICETGTYTASYPENLF